MKKKLFFVLWMVGMVLTVSASSARPTFGEKPKLVVGIVVD
jgi:hypothetical protein